MFVKRFWKGFATGNRRVLWGFVAAVVAMVAAVVAIINTAS